MNCFLKRAHSLSSNWMLFHNEVLQLRKIFLSNGYNLHFFDSQVRKFLSKAHCDHASDLRDEHRQNDCFTFVLPYFGPVSEKVVFQLRRLCKRNNLTTRVVFKPFKVSQYFSLKSGVPHALKSCLVYKYVCPRDSRHTYIGKTKRHLIERIREHQSSETAVRVHCISCKCFSQENFSVLRVCSSDYDATIAEALLIRNFAPTLNTSLTNSGQSTRLKL